MMGTRNRLRLLIVAGVFPISLLVAVLVGRMLYPQEFFNQPYLLVIPAAVGVLLLLRWPPLGLVGVVIAGMAVRYEISTGTATRINSAILVLVLVAGLWIFTFIVERRQRIEVRSRTLLPLIAFSAGAVISFAVGQLPWFYFAEKASPAAQLGGLAVFLLAVLGFFMVAELVRNERWLEWMVWAFLALGAVHVAGQIVPGLGAYTNKIISDGAYSNSIFWIWLIALSFSQAAFNRRLHIYWRAALIVLLVGALYIALVRDQDWISGWLPPLTGLAVALWASNPRLAWLGLGAGGIGALFNLERIRSVIFVGDNEYSLITRLEAWRILGEIVRSNPILGLGPANYYWYTPLYSILGYSVEFNSHNNYVDMIAQVGLLGLVLFAWFSFEVGWLGWKLRTLVPEGFPRAYVYGALGGLGATIVAGMFGDWFLPFIYNVGLKGFRVSLLGWMFLGGLVALEQIYAKNLDHHR